MTPEERLANIEHVTAALAEDRRKDREEYKQLWRDAQRRMDELSANIERVAKDSLDADRRLGARLEQLADSVQQLGVELREEDRRLGGRVDALVSAIGDFLRSQK